MSIYKNIFIAYLSVISLLTLSSCYGIKHSTISGSKPYYQSFFIGDEGTQYFIKPIEFYDNKSKLYLDITFRAKTELNDSAIVNFTIRSQHLHRQIDSAIIGNNLEKYELSNINLIFTERKNNIFNSRFSANIALIELANISEGSNWSISITSQTAKYQFIPTKSTKRIIKNLNNDIFILFK